MINTMEKLSAALGNPDVRNGDALVDLAVNELKHVQDLRSCLSMADNRNSDLSQSLEDRNLTVERLRCLNQTQVDSNAAQRRSLDLEADHRRRTEQSNDALKHDLEVATETATELREYIDYLLQILGTQQRMLKVIARVGDGTVARLVDNTLAGYYDD